MFSVYWRNYCDWLRSGPGVTINLILAHSGPICMYDCLCCILDEMDINSLCRSRWWQQSVLLQWIFWFAAGVIWVKMQDCGDRVCSWTSEQSVSQNVVNWIIESCFISIQVWINDWLACYWFLCLDHLACWYEVSLRERLTETGADSEEWGGVLEVKYKIFSLIIN